LVDLKTGIIIFTKGRAMYVCICRAVTEERVRASIEAGADTIEAVAAACGAGSDCGACHEIIEDRIESHKQLPVVRAA
jgi:bacterioferritin-associated ferredoxin